VSDVQNENEDTYRMIASQDIDIIEALIVQASSRYIRMVNTGWHERNYYDIYMRDIEEV